MEILNRIQVQGLISVKASPFAFGISVARGPQFFQNFSFKNVHNYEIIRLSETYLNHDTLSDIYNLKIPGYELVRVDHSSDQKRDGICIYHKDFRAIKVNNISCLK